MAIRYGFKWVFTFAGMFLMCSLPYLFFDIERQLKVLAMIDKGIISNTLFIYDSINLNWKAYFEHVIELLKQFFSFKNPNYYNKGSYLPLFPELWFLYLKSMLLLITSLFIGVIFSLLITFFIMKGGVPRRKWSSAFLFVFESLPDIFIIFIMQYFIIITYKKTGLLLFNIADSYNDPAFMMPVLCLSVLPTVFLTKNLLNSFQDEEKQLYVELALGKGMPKTYVLVVHILRNAFLSLFRHFKTIFWFTLSNLFILEIMFNIRGVMKFVTHFSPMTPDLTLYVLILFVFPYLLFYFLFQLVFFRMGLDGGNKHA